MSTRIKKKKWPRKNLGELLNFLEEQHPDGISLNDLAEKMDMERGGVSNMFRKDDARLSKVEQIARQYGYELKLFFPVRHLEEGYIPRPPRIHYENSGNLAGLAKYMQDSEFSFPLIADGIGVSPGVLHRAFRSGDIKLSTFNALIDMLGICVIWKFLKINDDEN